MRRFLAFASTASIVAACGSRTGLLVPSARDGEAPDALADFDGFIPPDGPDICPDAGATLIYVITSENTLLSFYPPTATFTMIGQIDCPDSTSTPFSMGVDRQGVAYVVFRPSGNLFRVSTRTAACGPTSFVPGNGSFPLTFGMGFSANGSGGAGGNGGGGGGGDAGETLYLAGDPQGDGGIGATILATLDVSTFTTHPIATVTPTINGAELTGTAGGQLFGFYGTNQGSGSAAIVQLDKATARVLSSTSLPAVDVATGWAFASWGGDFYTFTAPDGVDTTVQRYRPSDTSEGTVVTVATLYGYQIVGAGVSTCAPRM